MDDQELFGSRIRSMREAAGLSREAAAEKAEINTNYLGEIERGEKWRSGRLSKLFNVWHPHCA